MTTGRPRDYDQWLEAGPVDDLTEIEMIDPYYISHDDGPDPDDERDADLDDLDHDYDLADEYERDGD